MLREQWNSLLKETTSDNIFLTWEWLYTWSKHYLGPHKLWVILVYKENNQLVGIAPLYILKAKLGGISIREMKFLGTEEVSSSYLDFIVSERNKIAVLRHIYLYLHGEASGLWDILTLSEIPAESSSIEYWVASIQEAGKLIDIVGTTICPIIKLSGHLEDFLQGISSNERYNLRRKRKRFDQEGQVTMVRASRVQDIHNTFDDFIRLHQMRWDGKGSGGVFRSDRFLRFHWELTTVLSEQGRAHLDFLLLNGKKAAGIYGYTYNRRFYFYLPGFDPTVVPKASPGILLLFHCIEEAIKDECEEFDLLRGAAPYKMAWANSLRRTLTLRNYNKNIRGAASKLLKTQKDCLKILLR